MHAALPVVLIPGLLCSPRFYAAQIPALWRSGPVTVADHTRDDSMTGIAKRILADAPPRFALAGHSMGGYIAFEILRQAPDRVARLALLDTSARADTAEQTAKRKEQIAQAQAGHFGEIPDLLYPNFVHPGRREDAALRGIVHAMAEDAGAEAFVRQLTAIMQRPDSLPGLPAIRCPTLVLVGDQDVPTPPERAAEIAAGIAGARLVTIPDCGHLSAIEQPEAVTQALEAWLRG
ncbi:MAG: alpha/beta fold hydrolase [Burkholderiales bacterium]